MESMEETIAKLKRAVEQRDREDNTPEDAPTEEHKREMLRDHNRMMEELRDTHKKCLQESLLVQFATQAMAALAGPLIMIANHNPDTLGFPDPDAEDQAPSINAVKPDLVAKLSFDIAQAMLAEFNRRRS